MKIYCLFQLYIHLGFITVFSRNNQKVLNFSIIFLQIKKWKSKLTVISETKTDKMIIGFQR